MITATYSKKNFIQPGFELLDQIRIRDVKNVVRLTIYNNSGSVFFTNGSNIKIKTASENNIITLDFSTKKEATEALIMLKDAYSIVIKNFNDKKKAVIDPEILEFNSDNLNISNGQTVFPIPDDANDVFLVSINGVVITPWEYIVSDSVVSIDVNVLGYDIDIEDEVVIKYFR